MLAESVLAKIVVFVVVQPVHLHQYNCATRALAHSHNHSYVIKQQNRNQAVATRARAPTYPCNLCVYVYHYDFCHHGCRSSNNGITAKNQC